MKAGFCFIVLILAFHTDSKAQDNSFYAKGYILNKEKDTTWCKIWFNPDTPYFKKEIYTWINEEEQVISLENNMDLAGFGISEGPYKFHFGKIRLQGLSSWVFTYARKLATGVLELYEYRFMLVKKEAGSSGLTRELSAAYYIDRTDNNRPGYPELIRSMKKKKLLPYFKEFPEFEKDAEEEVTPDQLLQFVLHYNIWFNNKVN